MAKREKRVKYRRVIQLVFAAISNSYLTGFATGTLYKGNLKMVCNPGLSCYSCPGAVMSCPIGSLQAVIGSRAFSVSLYVFGLILMFGALMGRAVCGFLCPFGWVQELLHKIPFPVKRNRFKGDKQLRYLKYVVLLVFVLILPMTLNNEAGNARRRFARHLPGRDVRGRIPHVYFGRAAAPASGSGLVKSLNIVPTQSGPRWARCFLKMALLAAVVLLSWLSTGRFVSICACWAVRHAQPWRCTACGWTKQARIAARVLARAACDTSKDHQSRRVCALRRLSTPAPPARSCWVCPLEAGACPHGQPGKEGTV